MAFTKAHSRAIKLARFDQALNEQAGGLFAGIDEAGRGPLAGPVVASAVVFPPGTKIKGVDDSKALTHEQREAVRVKIEKEALSIGVGIVDPEIIDSINILQATLLAAKIAVSQLTVSVNLLMTDFLKVNCGIAVRAEIEADSKSLAVAAASIIAKTTRDRMMVAYNEEYPGYGFDGHKGYCCPEHFRALEKLGPCTLHRLSFNGVSLFTVDARPSLSFARMTELHAAGHDDFLREGALLLQRQPHPLVDVERRQLQQWLQSHDHSMVEASA